MNNYKLINNQDNLSLIVRLIRNGFMSSTIVRDMRIYDRFYSLDGSKLSKYDKLSEEFKIHPKVIQRIVLKLNKEAR